MGENQPKYFEEKVENGEETWMKQVREREEYLGKLKKWLDEARLWHYNVCSGLPCSSDANTANSQHPQQQINNIFASLNQANTSLQNVLQRRFLNAQQNIATPVFQTSTPQPTQPPSTYEFVIPPLWKRMVAELMDFLLLFLVKIALTFLLLESFDIIDMEFYGFQSFQKNLENSEITMPLTTELLTLELLHRLIVGAYETYYLKGKLCATPGKRYMGLMVITAESISPVPGRLTETVVTTGAMPLGWQKSLTRAAFKNLFVGLLLPLCVAFYIFPHNRTSYDMLSNSIVVEYHQEFILYNTAI